MRDVLTANVVLLQMLNVQAILRIANSLIKVLLCAVDMLHIKETTLRAGHHHSIQDERVLRKKGLISSRTNSSKKPGSERRRVKTQRPVALDPPQPKIKSIPLAQHSLMTYPGMQ